MTGSAVVLIAALLLDAALGEPGWLWSRLPHPAVLMGRAVGWLDNRLNRGSHRRARGVLAVALLVIGAGGIGLALQALPGHWADVVVVAILVAQRSLTDHVGAVAKGLRQGLAEGRLAVAMIVGRDVQVLDEAGVARAAIESGAENLSDGVIAPALWYLAGGLPGILICKAVNTADSMIGHRTPRHAEFGWAAARLDDVLMWVPARVTAMLIGLGLGRPGGWGPIVRDARQHRSPNAGWPEAAMARGIDVALSGPRSYGGQMQSFAFVHPQGCRTPGPAEIASSVRALWRAWGVLLAATVLLALM
ncbi:adenosylcobinamide-phosphate synthase CbiB [Tropicimonas sp. IMCC34043]|uniref:adenosylcobinamide-phosphate synthase CbiB n=1 Tax=Tropicimonas sp. IMCC34043 TaxID=2248760 RepID=UPI000E245A34|nr:adenosylcobinamide-phosphate synthase CbiB [Tropicimonas sp. IMCC34043]